MKTKQPSPEKRLSRRERRQDELERLACTIWIVDRLRETFPGKSEAARRIRDVLLVDAYRLTQIHKELKSHG